MSGKAFTAATVWPLAALATALSSSLWLRVFPAGTIAVPLFGAAVLSVAVSGVAIVLTRRALWVTATLSAVAFVVFTLVAVLRDPLGFGALMDGFVHGPSRLLTYALPLISPLSLLVAPVAVCWLGGAIAAESLARSRFSLVPYAAWLASFALTYAGTSRAAGSNRWADVAVGGGLLLTLALMRVAQVWNAEDRSAQSTGPDGTLPLRGLVVGTLLAVVVTAVAAVSVQAAPFVGSPRSIQRVPAVNQGRPVTPLAFTAGLRTGVSRDVPLLDVETDRVSTGYIELASVDFYDGDSWSFDRSFRPSGGIVPADVDPDLAVPAPAVTQHYRVRDQALAAGPWLPAMYRAARVTGTAISVDPDSGMIVPTVAMRAGDTYTVRSAPAARTFASLGRAWQPATSAPPIDTQLPGSAQAELQKVVTVLAQETGQDSTSPAAFLSAVAVDLADNYGLAASSTAVAGAAVSPSLADTQTAVQTGGTTFAGVLAAILGPQRSGTPEQYATLFALVARAVGVPARVVTGFRIPPTKGPVAVAGPHTLTGAQSHTWVEIPVRGAGWVVVDPSPLRTAGQAAAPSVGAQPSATPSVAPTQAALITQGPGGHAIAPKSAVPQARPGRLLPVVATVALILVLVGILAVLLLLARKRRRLIRRRAGGDPRTRVLGAWHETLDVLSESGMGEVAGLTSSEVAAATSLRFGDAAGAHAGLVGTAANRAIYSPDSVIAALTADSSWISHRAVRHSVRRTLPPTQRVRAALRYHDTTARSVRRQRRLASTLRR